MRAAVQSLRANVREHVDILQQTEEGRATLGGIVAGACFCALLAFIAIDAWLA